ncbi:hypothetical protein HD806DRAFT_104783 [Xylariaceae sp. AK1471]|nr:hypothetical protein HD806DRAFT_104783 [Xylariaceae sp. AK1471]
MIATLATVSLMASSMALAGLVERIDQDLFQSAPFTNTADHQHLCTWYHFEAASSSSALVSDCLTGPELIPGYYTVGAYGGDNGGLNYLTIWSHATCIINLEMDVNKKFKFGDGDISYLLRAATTGTEWVNGTHTGMLALGVCNDSAGQVRAVVI